MVEIIYTQDEALEILRQNGVEITSRTLQNYIKDGLIPMPSRKNLGRAGGVVTTYTLEGIAQAYAAWKLLNGEAKATSIKLKEIREIALHIVDNNLTSRKELLADEYLRAKLDKKPLEVYLLVEWSKARAKIFYRDLKMVQEEIYNTHQNMLRYNSEGNIELVETCNEKLNELLSEKNLVEFYSEEDSSSYHISGLYGFVVKFSWEGENQ